MKYSFIVDSGADITLVPRYLADRIGLKWKAGEKVVLKGISEKEICDVEGMIHEVEEDENSRCKRNRNKERARRKRRKSRI